MNSWPSRNARRASYSNLKLRCVRRAKSRIHDQSATTWYTNQSIHDHHASWVTVEATREMGETDEMREIALAPNQRTHQQPITENATYANEWVTSPGIVPH